MTRGKLSEQHAPLDKLTQCDSWDMALNVVPEGACTGASDSLNSDFFLSDHSSIRLGIPEGNPCSQIICNRSRW